MTNDNKIIYSKKIVVKVCNRILVFRPKNGQHINYFDADNDIIRRTQKTELIQGITVDET